MTDTAAASNPPPTVQRYGSMIRLPQASQARYLELHAAVWPAVEATLTRANIRNYTIFLRDELLFSYYEYVGTDHAADQALIAADPATQEWWTHTDPLQERLPGTPDGQQWAPLTQVWHLD